MDFVGGFPADGGFTGVGIRAAGEDATGEPLAFNGWQAIPQE